jgi:hypothetical protein
MTPSSYWVLGVDPGRKGAIAALRPDRSEHRLLAMPMLEKSIDTRAVRDFLEALRLSGELRHAVIEKSQVLPKQGAVSGFTYGRNYGVLVTILEFMGVPFQEEAPAKWKHAVIGASGVLKSAPRKKKAVAAVQLAASQGELLPVDALPAAFVPPVAEPSSSAKKKALKELAVLTARRMFPTAVFRSTEDGKAEALLIAEASRRIVLHGTMNDTDKKTDLKKEALAA